MLESYRYAQRESVTIYYVGNDRRFVSEVLEGVLYAYKELEKYFQLEDEYPLLRPNGPNRNMTLSGDGKITIMTKSGQKKDIVIPSYGHFVSDGVFHAIKR